MGCCNQAPKGGTGKLSYLMLVIAGLFAAIFLIAVLWGEYAIQGIVNTRLCLSKLYERRVDSFHQ